MAYDNVVINFGSPRSGTTIMRRLLGPLKDTYVSKLHEATALHPWRSKRGLLDISQWMLKDRLVFVRTVRHPLNVVESFLALRTDELRQNNASLAAHSDERIIAFIVGESEGAAAQRHEVERNRADKGWEHHFVQARYERLGDESYQREFAWDVCRHLSTPERSFQSLTRRLAEEWKQRPVRDGKLRAGMDERIMTDGEEARWRAALQDVIEREGYE